MNEEKIEEEKDNLTEVKVEESNNSLNEVKVEDANNSLNETKKANNNKSNKTLLIVLVVLLLVIAVGVLYVVLTNKNTTTESKEISDKKYHSEYRMSGNSLENFDLYFLKLENTEENMIYSPLSIKYALEMLAEGANGATKEQITSVIGDYTSKKYVNSDNMSLANAMFIRDSFKNLIISDYTTNLQNKYNAEIIYDSFESPENINNWVSNKTFKLIDKLFSDVSNYDFALVNALAIDMEWNNKFLKLIMATYPHEKSSDENYTFGWSSGIDLVSSKFENMNEQISGMDIKASLNNYDIVKIIGEDNIRKTVGDAYREYLNNPTNSQQVENILNNDKSEENINKVVDDYLEDYIKTIGSNYGNITYSTDFSFYVDDSVKVFAKDLKEYNGTTLQYVGIMPTNDTLSNYITNTDASKINTIINNLKELKLENVKKDAITYITGYIPKFKFEYKLDLVNDLKKMGIEDVFDSKKANLSKLTSNKGSYITDAIHKANIEFTQDGIKAAAATGFGGGGAGDSFDYLYEVPIERIDLTFDKPYMFLIRDKETGEVWFTGEVYEPLLWSEDKTTLSNYQYQY